MNERKANPYLRSAEKDSFRASAEMLSQPCQVTGGDFCSSKNQIKLHKGTALVNPSDGVVYTPYHDVVEARPYGIPIVQ